MRQLTRIDLSKAQEALRSLNAKYPLNSNTPIDLNGLTVDESALLCPNPSEFYKKAYLRPNFTDFRVIVGVKEATKITTSLFQSEVLQGINCGWNSLGSEINAKLITPCKFNVMEEVCLWDIETSYLSDLNPIISEADFFNHYWNVLSEQVGANLARVAWQGASYSTGFVCDGFEYKIDEDEDVLNFTQSKVSSSIPFNKTTIEAAFETLITNAPPEILQDPDQLRFYVSPSNKFIFSLAASSNNTINYVTKELDLFYLGIRISVQPGMSNDRIILTRGGGSGNLIYTINTAIDTNQLRVVDLRQTTNEDVIRVKLAGHLAFDIVNGHEILQVKAV
jgi:hypothetical protein